MGKLLNPKRRLWQHLAAVAQTAGPTACRESTVWAAAARWCQSQGLGFHRFPTPHWGLATCKCVLSKCACPSQHTLLGRARAERRRPPVRRDGGCHRWLLRASVLRESSGMFVCGVQPAERGANGDSRPHGRWSTASPLGRLSPRSCHGRRHGRLSLSYSHRRKKSRDG